MRGTMRVLSAPHTVWASHEGTKLICFAYVSLHAEHPLAAGAAGTEGKRQDSQLNTTNGTHHTSGNQQPHSLNGRQQNRRKAATADTTTD